MASLAAERVLVAREEATVVVDLDRAERLVLGEIVAFGNRNGLTSVVVSLLPHEEIAIIGLYHGADRTSAQPLQNVMR